MSSLRGVERRDGINMSKTGVAPWCYKWDGMRIGVDESAGGLRYRAPYVANEDEKSGEMKR